MHILSKSSYIKGLQCEKALYLSKKHPYLRDRLSMAQRMKFKRGTNVGIFAQQCFPSGVNMAPSSPSLFPQKAKETMANIANPEINTMYEAVFQYDDTLIMVDIITRDGDKWRAIEVKSSMRLSQTYYNDAALQYYVLKGCGIELCDFQLMYVNPDYIRNGDINVKDLFKTESVIEYASSQIDTIGNNIGRLKHTLEQPHSPMAKIGTQCRKPYVCEFIGHCWKTVPENSILYCSTHDDETLFDIYFNKKGIPNDTFEQLNALNNNTFNIDYKIIFSLNPQPRPNKIAFLSTVCHYPAIPEADGERPYQKKLLAYSLCSSTSGTIFGHCTDNHNRNNELEKELSDNMSNYDMVVCFGDTPNPSSIKTLDLQEVLANGHFFHRLTKYDLSLDILETILVGKTIEGHDMATNYALECETDKLKNCLLNETDALSDIYYYFFKN